MGLRPASEARQRLERSVTPLAASLRNWSSLICTCCPKLSTIMCRFDVAVRSMTISGMAAAELRAQFPCTVRGPLDVPQLGPGVRAHDPVHAQAASCLE